jgi:hypothetical protein
MEINLNELIVLHTALVNVKMFLSQKRKIESNELAALVDEAYELVMKKIDSSPQPSYL